MFACDAKKLRDAWKRRETEIVGIDAVPFNRFAIQFTAHSILRELNKAFVGFYGDGQPPEHLSAIATGNWGCGAFGGDKELKSLLQLMAAAEANRDVAYFTFSDRVFMQELHRVYVELITAKCDVGRLFQLIGQYADEEVRSTAGDPNLSLFEFISQQLAEEVDGE
uniref:Poly(ADP-ribose) glycohydrolase n=1 Tax=Plectus sambesii TaxID=2011161 RepID=A0A914WIL6_9BILA